MSRFNYNEDDMQNLRNLFAKEFPNNKRQNSFNDTSIEYEEKEDKSLKKIINTLEFDINDVLQRYVNLGTATVIANILEILWDDERDSVLIVEELKELIEIILGANENLDDLVNSLLD